MFPIELAAQRMNLRDEEWQPLGASRLSLNFETYSRRMAYEGRHSGPLIGLCGADEDDAANLRLAAQLSHVLGRDGTLFQAVGRAPWPGTALLQVAAAHNALSRAIDENLLGGNRARLDPRRLTWPRCIADGAPHRQLRRVVTGLDSEATLETIPREESFVTPEQSELAALLTLASGEDDLLARLERLIIGWRGNGEAIFATAVLPLEELRRLLPHEILQPEWGLEAFASGEDFDTNAMARFEAGGTRDLPFGGYAALRAAQFSGGALMTIGGGMPGARSWFDVFCPACNVEARAFVIRASVEAIRDWGEEAAARMGSEEWMAGLNVLQGRITLLDRFGLPPIVAVEAERGEIGAANSAVHVLDSYGIRAVAIERPRPGDAALPDISALAAMVREWLMMESVPHPFVMAGRAVREQIADIVSTVYGASFEWSGAAENQLSRLENAGAGEAPVVVEAEGAWDLWGGAHHLWGYGVPGAIITNVEWRAAAGYVRAVIRKNS